MLDLLSLNCHKVLLVFHTEQYIVYKIEIDVGQQRIKQLLSGREHVLTWRHVGMLQIAGRN